MSGQLVDNADLIRQQEAITNQLPLETLPHSQLVPLAKYFSIQYASLLPENFVRNKLMDKIAYLKKGDEVPQFLLFYLLYIFYRFYL